MALVPALLDSLVLPVRTADADDGGTNFTLVAVSDAAGGPLVGDRIFVNGGGRFGEHALKGGGSFTHFHPPATLANLKASGTWKARKFVSFTPAGSYGARMGGELVIEVNLIPSSGIKVPATMTIVCHAFGGPEPEGISLAVGGSTFTAHTPPPPSATLFSTGVIERN